MFGFIKKIFTANKEPAIEFDHEKLGKMCFIPDGKYWEINETDIFHSIPGNEQSPSSESIDFILSKLDSINQYWSVCAEELISIAHSWDSIDKSLSAQELFKISAISVNSVDNTEWEMCFETKEQYKWIYIGLHFKGEKIVANDITT